MSSMKDDELMLLWRQGTSTEPNPEEIARLAARASMRRFDQTIFWRNFREYAAGVIFLPFGIWMIVTDVVGIGRAFGLTAIICMAFTLGYLWWQHRGLAPLDPSANARAYQSAMLERLDKQIRLLGSVSYWYLMPLYLPSLWIIGMLWTLYKPLALVVLGLHTGAFIFIGWLNERWGVRQLQAKRARIETLYRE
jgi:hypothetical protein